MKSKEELDDLCMCIGKAQIAYRNANEENLRESGKEFPVMSDNEVEDKGLRMDVDGRHGQVNVVIDKVRYNFDRDYVEVHICEEDYDAKDYWCDINLLGEDGYYIYENVDWSIPYEDSKWKKVECTYNDGYFLHVDAWTDPEEEGNAKCIAIIDTISLHVYYLDLTASDDCKVKKVIKEAKEKLGDGNIMISKERYNAEHETIVQISADMYQEVYDLNEVYDFTTASSIIIDLALEFEEKWTKMKKNDDKGELDYLTELEKFENEKSLELHKEYD